MDKRYHLEIYEPESLDDVLYHAEADQPFQAFHVGDLVHPDTLSLQPNVAAGDQLEVVRVQHILFGEDPTHHKLCVFTKATRLTSLSGAQSLSQLQRLHFANQFRIMELVDPSEAQYYERHRHALERGFALHYPWMLEHYYEELGAAACKEVLDTLDMYRALTFSARKLDGDDAKPRDELRFRGYDGNNETAQKGYTHYFIEELDRYGELTYGREHPDFNSHRPMVPTYRRMLEVWRSHDRSFELTEEQIAEI